MCLFIRASVHLCICASVCCLHLCVRVVHCMLVGLFFIADSSRKGFLLQGDFLSYVQPLMPASVSTADLVKAFEHSTAANPSYARDMLHPHEFVAALRRNPACVSALLGTTTRRMSTRPTPTPSPSRGSKRIGRKASYRQTRDRDRDKDKDKDKGDKSAVNAAEAEKTKHSIAEEST